MPWGIQRCLHMLAQSAGGRLRKVRKVAMGKCQKNCGGAGASLWCEGTARAAQNIILCPKWSGPSCNFQWKNMPIQFTLTRCVWIPGTATWDTLTRCAWDTRYSYLGPKWPQSQHQSIFLRALSAKHAGIDYSIYVDIYIYIYTYIYPPTPLAAGGARQRRNYQQQGPRSHYKQQGQEARKQERRSKKQEAITGNKRQEARNKQR